MYARTPETMTERNVIDLRSFGAAAVAARIYRRKRAGEAASSRNLALIAKATFGIVPGAPLRWIAPLPIQREETHLQGNPIASLAAASDLAFDMQGAEITLSATASGPHSAETSSLDVGFEIHRARQTILTKRLTVVGARSKDGEPPRTFTAMPIVYERARGGMSNPINPVGADAPNILSTSGPASDAWPTGLGPIPSSWIVRRKHRGALSAKDAYATTEVDVPDDFSTAYFGVAPPDQRLPAFDPGDVVRLIHLHPLYPTLDFALPPVVARGAVEIEGEGRREIDLRLTSIHVEPDQLRATLTYRGSVSIGQASSLRAGVAVGMNAAEIPPLDQGEAVVDRGEVQKTAISKEGTHILVPTAIPAEASKAAPVAAHDFSGTVVMSDPVAPTSLPFAKGAAPKPKPSDRGAPPGSPWTTAPTKPVVPVAAAKDFSQTVVAPLSVAEPPRPAPIAAKPEPESAAKAEPAKAEPAKAEPPKAEPAKQEPAPVVSGPEPAKKKASVWREDPPEVAKPAAPAPPPVPKADISSLMYRKKR